MEADVWTFGVHFVASLRASDSDNPFCSVFSLQGLAKGWTICQLVVGPSAFRKRNTAQEHAGIPCFILELLIETLTRSPSRALCNPFLGVGGFPY